MDSQTHDVFWWLDLGLVVVGLGLFAGVAIHWRRARRDPLRGSPLRPNALNPLHVWVCLLANLLAWWLAALIARRVSFPKLDDEQLEAWRGVLTANISGVLILLACSTIAALTFRRGWHGFVFGTRKIRSEIIYSLAALMVALGLTGAISQLTEYLIWLFFPHFEQQEHAVFQMMDAPTTTAGMRAVILLGAFVLAPIAEEMFFRGILQTALRKIGTPRLHSMRHRWLAIVITAGIFGGMHGTTPQHIPALIVLGVVLGYIYERRGALITPIIVHMLFNGKSLLWRELERCMGM